MWLAILFDLPSNCQKLWVFHELDKDSVDSKIGHHFRHHHSSSELLHHIHNCKSGDGNDDESLNSSPVDFVMTFSSVVDKFSDDTVGVFN